MQAPLFETNVSPAGVGSVTLMLDEVAGPLLVTTTVKAIVEPGAAEAGPLFAIETSAPLIEVVVELLLLPGTGSLLELETDAVLVIAPVAVGETLKVEVIVAVWPLVIVPSAQGKAVVHAPLLETKVRLAGVGSLTVTPDASDGPIFVTVTV